MRRRAKAGRQNCLELASAFKKYIHLCCDMYDYLKRFSLHPKYGDNIKMNIKET
jgi:hypothetical protein